MTIEKSFSNSVAWMAAGAWIEQAFNFAVFVILARLLGAETIGLAAMAVSFLVLAASLVRETFTEYLIAHKDPSKDDYNAVFWCLIALGILLAVLMITLSKPIAAFYGEPEVATFLIALSPVVLMIALTAVPVAILRREMRFNILSIRAVAGVVIGGITGIILALTDFGVWALILQYLTLIAVNAALAWFAVDWRPGRPPSAAHLKEVAKFGTQVMGLRTAELTATQGPLVMIGATLGATALGQFSIAWRLIEIGSFLVVTPLRMTSQSAFAAILRTGKNAADLLDKLLKTIALLALPAFIGLATLAPFVIPTIFGTGWEEAVPVLQILSAAGIFFCFEKVQQAYCLAAGRAGQVTLVTWAEAILGILLIWIFASYGIAAVAIVFSLRFYLLWPIRFKIVENLGGGSLSDTLKTTLKPAIISLIMAAITLAITQILALNPLLSLIIGTISGALIFGLLTTLFMRDRLTLAIDLAKGEGAP